MIYITDKNIHDTKEFPLLTDEEHQKCMEILEKYRPKSEKWQELKEAEKIGANMNDYLKEQIIEFIRDNGVADFMFMVAEILKEYYG